MTLAFSWLLNASYTVLILCASPAIAWQALRHGKYRQGWKAKLFGIVELPRTNRPVIWLHAVSVGEVKLAAKMAPQFVQRFPRHELVVSTTSRTGYALAKRELSGHCVTYAPLDFSWAVHTALRRLRPSALVLVELELWPNLIRLARERGAQVFIANGRLSERSFLRYLWVRPLLKRLLKRVTWIGAQDSTYQRRFKKLGADCCDVTGSIKFDDLETERENSATGALVELSAISPDDHVFIAGSTQPIEDEIVLSAFSELSVEFPRLRLVLVPRHPENFSAACGLAATSGLTWQRRSEIEAPCDPNWRVLVVDSVGELSAWWGRADIAFVGGSLCDRGGQNMIEPAAFGAAVCFGPNTVNFKTISEALVSRQAAEVVTGVADLVSFVRRSVADARYRDGLGRAAAEWVQSQAGALDRTCHAIDRHIGSFGSSASPLAA